MIWDNHCVTCESFCPYGTHYWCKVKNISVMPFTQACKKYTEDTILEELVDNDDYVQDLMFGRL